MSAQLPREWEMVITTTPGLELPSTPAVEHGLDPCCKLKPQSMELINGNRSSSELYPEGTQVCGCFSSPRPRDPRAGICTRAGKQPGPTEALLIPCLCGTVWEGEPGAPGNVITAEGLAESGGSFPY